MYFFLTIFSVASIKVDTNSWWTELEHFYLLFGITKACLLHVIISDTCY